MIRLKITAALCAALIAVMCAACSDSGSDKDISSKNSAVSEADKSDGKDSSSDNDADSSVGGNEDSSQTDYSNTLLGRTYDFLNSESYSLRIKYTDFEGKVTEIYKVSDGDNFYQLQTNDIGESGSIRVGEECYDFDLVCGIYRKSSAEKPDSIIESVIEENLPMTSTHINEEDAEMYDVEEYTYTGDTYITVMDFCFDKSTGALVKYTATYSVEGEDDVTETREFYDFIPAFEPIEVLSSDGDSSLAAEDSSVTESSLDDNSSESEPVIQEIDRSVFNTDFIQTLVDFNNMTEERRLGYCQAIFVTAGVSADELAQAEITDEKLKTISYEEFTSVVYLYGYN
ncbi:MAG: hypothetical protein Q4E74_03675 [Ruminococcus sp.]|nr:hypothetical protein [Ruminococcus sp.]